MRGEANCHPAPNTYEDPRCQETDFPCEWILPIFFRLPGQAQSASGNVFRLHFRLLVRQTEALRTAMGHFGNPPLTALLKALGAEGLLPPITLSWRDHEGGGGVQFQQWDGTQWNAITDWIATDQALVRPLVEASAAKSASGSRPPVSDAGVIEDQRAGRDASHHSIVGSELVMALPYSTCLSCGPVSAVGAAREGMDSAGDWK